MWPGVKRSAFLDLMFHKDISKFFPFFTDTGSPEQIKFLPDPNLDTCLCSLHNHGRRRRENKSDPLFSFSVSVFPLVV